MLYKIIFKNFKSNLKSYILFFISNIIAAAELLDVYKRQVEILKEMEQAKKEYDFLLRDCKEKAWKTDQVAVSYTHLDVYKRQG